MSLERAVEDVLARLSDAQVDALAEASREGTSMGAVAAGASPGAVDAIARLKAEWKSHGDLTGSGVALALAMGLRARRNADACRGRPVWTGPGAAGEQRLTAAVLHELIAAARDRVLLMSFAANTLPEVATDLEAAVARGCQVDVVFETGEDSAGAYSGPKSKPFGAVAGVCRWSWPSAQREEGAVLHAKLLVVDGRRALVGSANLTHRALTANLEAGVLLADPQLAFDLEAHVRRLMKTGVLVRADAGV